jgi:integrase
MKERTSLLTTTDIGLGSYPAVGLADAWVLARRELELIKQGVDTVQERRESKSLNSWTFKHCCETYIASHRAEWTNNKHAQQWENTLATYAYPKIGNKHVKDITLTSILSVIEPDWATKTETMNRVRQRIEAVLAWAAVKGYRERLNPAVWRNNLDQVLPKKSKVSKPRPHPALQTKDAQRFCKTLASAEGAGARCLRFLMLTACRSNEARGAAWSEIDLESAEWLIPAERMKADAAHRIPLSNAAVVLLRAQLRYVNTDLIFVGNNNSQLSDMTLSAVIKRMNKPKVIWADETGRAVVPHGLRSTFATWAQESTHYPSELREHALAERVGNSTTLSYERGAQFEKRRSLMEDWAVFITSSSNAGLKVA